MELKCILADVDGTLVNEGRVMGDVTKDVLRHLQKKGILLGIASGRPLDELPATVQNFHAEGLHWDFYIGMNGGEVYDGILDETHVFYPLSPSAIQEGIEMFWDVPYVTPIIYKEHALMASRWNEILEVSKKHANKEAIIARDPAAFWQAPTGKIMLRTLNAQQCDEIEAYAKAHPSKDFAAFKTQPTLLELQDPRVNKGVALQHLCQAHGWDPSMVAAFGDASNDNEMLEAAGLGVCLCNGLDDTKACADEWTEYDNEQDGMARYLVKKFPELFEDMEELPPVGQGYFAPSEMPDLQEAQNRAAARNRQMGWKESRKPDHDSIQKADSFRKQ